MILSALLLLSACATPQAKVITQSVYVKKNVPILNRPKGVNLNKVKFFVVNEKNLDKFISEWKSREGNLVFVAISVKDYENLSLNISDLKRYIKQQKEIIVYYEEAVKR